MILSIVAAALICAFYQKLDVYTILRTMIFGYRCGDPRLSEMMNGGGITSMLNVMVIVCLSSSYEGIFEETGLLGGLKGRVAAFGEKTSRFLAIFCTSAIACMISCNQSLATMLTHQICGQVEKDEKKLAIDMENSVIVIAPLIPWSIAGAAPLSSMSAPTACLAAACYLYLLPLWQLLVQRNPRAEE